MSHVNDIICVLRGLRLVAEAGVTVQKEASQIIWNNSSFKSALQNLPSNTLTPTKPNSDIAKDLIERALVVAQGFKQYAVLNIPNFNTNVESKAEMDPELKDEIDELNREFNKTFESLKQSQNTTSQPTTDFIAPLENIQVPPKMVNVPEVERQKPKIPPFPNYEDIPKSSQPNEAVTSPPKPSAKKKVRVTVSISFFTMINCKKE